MAEKNVRIRLFKDNSRYKGDLFVSVNGVNYKIRRGVEVEVPPAVAEVLEHSQRQDELTAARIAAAENAALPRQPQDDVSPLPALLYCFSASSFYVPYHLQFS